MTPDAAMVFAAGFGTRMGALTKDRPKPLIKVAGRTLLDRTLDLANAAGIARKVVNTHYLGAQIAAHLAGRDVTISHEGPAILDTGGGLRAALPLLGANPVFTANSDAVFAGPNPFTVLAEAWAPEQMEALLLLVPVDRAAGRDGGGDFSIGPEERLTRGGDLVYSGMQIIRIDRVAAEDEAVFSLNRTWGQIAEAGKLFGAVYPGRWCDVGHPGGIGLAEDLLESRDV